MTKPLNPEPIDRVQRAIEELTLNRDSFSEESYRQILVLLYKQLGELQGDAAMTPPVPLPAVRPDDELRLVSVMFIDVVDSTEMIRQMGAENWRRFINELHRRLSPSIEQWGGEIGQFLGDGILCYFGSRQSRGNDATRAVSCALELQNVARQYMPQVEKLNSENDGDSHSDLMRIGITTGRVLVGSVGNEEKGDRLAIGDTTNLAARLQSICPPGGVLVDIETYRRTRNEFTYKTMPAQKIKGFPEPIANYAVIGEVIKNTGKLSSTTIGNIPIPFVGREPLIDKIMDSLYRVERNDSFESVTLYGDNGVGKSRVLQECSISSVTNAFLVLRAVAQYESQQTPYSLLRDVLANLCDLSDSSSAQESETRLLAYAKRHWPDVPENVGEAATAVVGYLAGYGFHNSAYTQPIHRSAVQQNSPIMLRMVRQWFRGVANERPIFIIVDNLQWLDDESVALLQDLYYHDGGMMILAAGRSGGEAPPPLFEGNGHLIETLERLSDQAVRDMVTGVTGAIGELPGTMMTQIVQRAQGNPLFVEEFLRMLFDNGVFYQDNIGSWKIDTFTYHDISERLPTGLWGIFQARLDDLTLLARRLVMVASVVGQNFWESSVSVVLNFDAHDAIEELLAKGIIIKRNESRFDYDDEYTFRNNMYYEVAYNMITYALRVAYHRQVAAWLLAHMEKAPDLLVQLAQQYSHGNLPLEAIRTYVAAAEQQLIQGRLTDAMQIIEQGQQVSRQLSREDALPPVCRLWVLKGRVAYSRRHYAEAVANSDTALNLMKELPTDSLVQERIAAGVTLGAAHTGLGAYDEALEALTQAYQLLNVNEVSLIERATVLRSFGMLSWAQGRLQQANLYQRQALEIAEASQDKRSITASRSMLGRIMLDRGDLANALRMFEQVHETNTMNESVLYQMIDLQLIASIYRDVFAFDMALQVLQQAEELSQRVNYDTPLINMGQALAYIGIGRKEQGLEMLRLAEDYEHVNVYDHYDMQLSLVKGLILAGEFAEGEERAQFFIERVKSHNPVLYGRGLMWLGVAEHNLGRPNAAQTLRWALDNEITYGGRYVWSCHYMLADVLPAEEKRAYHQRQAQFGLDSLAESFAHRPDLQRIIKMSIARRHLADITRNIF